ncbi:cation/multidrug efflux pump [Desulfitobacterium dichloroeliminans LMG P-21439]|uniref:Cation/multidrug efflux pump n=1 Tax=Desulfitobacterium dichloroeliminans (strain LMG P-21439 / DCA1) TaxID=871963 RepID=L0FA10_DESDL|nr:efflux RND transporter permease subunit [Desulfitobacterium dichloroeliminans]AGA70644.1 cation/multidrug efflux pump [Desulfitobacterium dichloroeliminans LMG P-21439]
MKLAETSVKRPVTIIMTVLIVILLGTVSLSRLPIDLFPEFELPMAIVMTDYSGVGPQEIEKLITNPIEGVVSSVENIDSVTSTTTQGSSIIMVNFKTGTDMNFATLQMREKIDMIKFALPEGASSPMVLKLDISMMPIMQLTMTSESADLAQLQALAEDDVKPRIERVKGVASVSISGGYENEIKISTHQEKMQGYGLSISALAGVLGAENLNSPAGEVQKGNQDLTIRTTGEFQSLEEIENLLIPLNTGGQVRLKDIADVELGHTELAGVSRTNGVQSVSISVQKQSGTNTVAVAEDIAQAINELKGEYPDLSLDVVYDESVYIQQTIDTVSREALLGGLLAIVILFIFFHNLRTTFITATAIPIAVMATFACLYFLDVTINMMTLGGLSLAMGRLVDDNIVALENIYRYRQAGHSKVEAAIKGVSEVGMAITASTLTTVAVFLPIVFVEGLTATLFRDLALTVGVSLGASLLVSLTLVPALSAKIMKVGEIPEGRTGLKGLFDRFGRGFDNGFSRVEKSYRRFLHYALGHRKTIVIGSVLIFILSGATTFFVGAEFMPASDAGQLTVNVKLPDGAQLEDTDAVIAEVEKQLEGISEVQTAFTQVGSGGLNTFGSASGNSGSVMIQLIPLAERNRSVTDVAEELRALTKDIPGAEIDVAITDMMSMGTSSPISIAIKGDELDQLEVVATDIQAMVASVEGTREVKTSMGEGIPEVQVAIDRERASKYGLTAYQIANGLKGTLSGTTATQYRYEGKEINVVISGDETFKQSIANLEQTPITTPLGISVPLSQIAEVSIERGPTAIEREDQARVVRVTSDIVGSDLAGITSAIQTKLDGYQLPNGYVYEMGGENEEMMQSFADLAMALVLAIVLVYMILAAQFESLIHPFTIIFSLPMGFSGGMLGLFITGSSISVPAFIGLILLTGIVVSNAIVLVDYINKRLEMGDTREEAIENAGPVRLRPIIMTSLTTALGLIPMALGMGEGSETMAPMAVVVVFGLTLSTVSTLILVPVIYTMNDDFKNFLKRKGKRKAKGVPSMPTEVQA